MRITSFGSKQFWVQNNFGSKKYVAEYLESVVCYSGTCVPSSGVWLFPILPPLLHTHDCQAGGGSDGQAGWVEQITW